MTKILIIVVLIICLFPMPVLAQSEELALRLTRDWGYGAGGQIQGTFSLRVNGPDDIVQVDFIIDDVVVHTATESPLRYQFHTDDFPPGVHTMTAVGYKADGTPVYGPELGRQFLSADDAKSSTMKIIVPILIIVGLATLVGALAPALMMRGKEFKPGSYGAAGGAVCPRCTFPYSRNMLAPNLLVGKLQRCPHCGKWAIVARASQQNLNAAEERWAREGTSSVEAPSEEEKMRQLLDDSRYDD
ncbi:Ig-like domain-containing protein [Chloroflexota bacterium]